MCFSKYPDKFHIDQEGWLLLSQLENLHHHCCIPLPTLNYSFWHTLGFAKRHFGECRSLYLKVEWKYTKSSFSYNVISYIKIFNIWCFFNVYPVISFCISKHLYVSTSPRPLVFWVLMKVGSNKSTVSFSQSCQGQIRMQIKTKLNSINWAY